MIYSDKAAQSAFDSSRLSHAYIANGVLAETLAMAAVCSGQDDIRPCMVCQNCDKALRRIHPDISTVAKLPDKKEIIVGQIRELIKDIIIVPIEAERKVYIINDADLMNTEAQNSFLQVLEDPPSRVVFILKTDRPTALLATVTSRCVALHEHVAPEVVEADAASVGLADDLVKALDGGNLPLAVLMFRLDKLDKSAFAAFLAVAREKIVLLLAGKTQAEMKISRSALARAETVLAKADKMLELNVNVGHISGMICANLMSVESWYQVDRNNKR